MPFSVFANNMEIAGKSATGQSPAAFPDTCWTPPTAPPTPTGVPVPYPNTCMAKDLSSGSKTVMAHGKEVGMENKSYFSTSMGDEPATMALQKGLISQTEKGKCYFQMWSMNVKVEGSGVPRHLDIVTHNHRNQTNTPPMVYLSSLAIPMPSACKDEADAINKACKPEEGKTWRETHCGALGKETDGSPVKLNCAEKAEAASKKAKKDDCLNAQKCRLVPYSKADSDQGCCSNQTGHHVMPDAMFRDPEKGATFKNAWKKNPLNKYTLGKNKGKFKPISRGKMPLEKDWPKYTEGGGLTICAEGEGRYGSHGKLHANLDTELEDHLGKRHMPYADAKSAAVKSIHKDNKHCSKPCLEAQLDGYYETASNKNLKESQVQPHSGGTGRGYKVNKPSAAPKGTPKRKS